VVGRAGEELPAKATSLALRLTLEPNAPCVTYSLLMSFYHCNAGLYPHAWVLVSLRYNVV
jgi:hypothetical protein